MVVVAGQVPLLRLELAVLAGKVVVVAGAVGLQQTDLILVQAAMVVPAIAVSILGRSRYEIRCYRWKQSC